MIKTVLYLYIGTEDEFTKYILRQTVTVLKNARQFTAGRFALTNAVLNGW
jgi:hypothetical protein